MLLLNKVLPLFVLPIGIVCALLLLAVWRKKTWPVVAALGLVYAASLPLVADRLVGRLERDQVPLAVSEAGTADAVVVLGGILGSAHAPGAIPSWNDPVERYEAGVALVLAGRAEKLIFTGASRSWHGEWTTEGEQLRRLAIERGVPEEKIIVTRLVANTATEAAAVADLMRDRGWRKIILVTSAWHMPRSLLLFQRAGVACQPFPVDFRSDRIRTVGLMDFVPQGEAWMKTEMAIREMYGYAFYWVIKR